MPAKPELILVAPRTVLGTAVQFRGFRPACGFDPTQWLSQCQYQPRSEMENDPSFKQLIPYIVVRRGEEVFRYRRTKRAGESRLHHFYSIGVGGHINPVDDNLFISEDSILEEAARRELHEELSIDSSIDLEYFGIINDDNTDVGRVHLGIVYAARIESGLVAIRESSLSRGEWKSIPNLLDGVEYETWSEFVIDYLLQNGKII